ncbi:transaminase, acetylornithine/succinylornithine family [Treponema socranskii subsp. socranskii VPI DR56BR1116 = ATCC 35536]|uniref:Transaminase, acetylornithine/succinylornithine family n=1 Tax=Treponema socranskii subsp. socranskii VPI DR56BR1116 = ATCC 35536 TaxID=1125725 RepID=U2MPH8_TRESO|nr:acetylornithine/succinylornithine family transaminase [Treponema socranskii]ERF59374.1 transaminase, acetylornithine/succinylornithine family [Treponema socranskii subsp. socranskii VPI DR56BR1116 = ATCC 35536]ERK01184.1 transaminase, acetylornithine/succinylornithine family [Treponema socranskii subsp. socranskii VPI DR56BR1116 = ATCC 35536]
MEKKIVNNYGSFDVVFVKGEGAVLFDAEGKRYIDFIAGIGVNSLGHNYAPLVEAVQKQAAREIHISNYYLSDAGVAFADELLSATGFSGGFFGNSGAEANEAAIKLARKYGYMNGGEKRRTIYTLEQSFHGRTLATLTATGQKKFHPPYFAPYVADFKTIKANDRSAVETAFDDTTAALLIECVQGEGGVNLVDAEWVCATSDAARKAGAIVMADEVQTGMGRCGTLLASERLGFCPDVVTLAKGIAGGIPMGACLFRGKADKVFSAGDHQSTFAGNPLACSAGRVVLKTLSAPGFLDDVNRKGDYIRNSISGWKIPIVTDVRGLGLMIGTEIAGTIKPFDVEKRCLEKGLCVSTAGANVIRFLPPLTITDEEMDAGLAIFQSVLKEYV